MDNVLVEELTFMLKMHFSLYRTGHLMPCFDEVQLIFAVLLIGTCFLIARFSVSGSVIVSRLVSKDDVDVCLPAMGHAGATSTVVQLQLDAMVHVSRK